MSEINILSLPDFLNSFQDIDCLSFDQIRARAETYQNISRITSLKPFELIFQGISDISSRWISLKEAIALDSRILYYKGDTIAIFAQCALTRVPQEVIQKFLSNYQLYFICDEEFEVFRKIHEVMRGETQDPVESENQNSLKIHATLQKKDSSKMRSNEQLAKIDKIMQRRIQEQNLVETEGYGGQIQPFILSSEESNVWDFQSSESLSPLEIQFLCPKGLATEEHQAQFIQDKAEADQEHDAEAQFSVGSRYHHAAGVMRSYKEAFHYYTLAANQGHPDAIVAIGQLYETGTYVEHSEEKAVHCYQLAADQNHPYAQFLLGECYRLGQGVPFSMAQAIMYYEKAAQSGRPDAYIQLAQAYSTGGGVERSEEYAKACYQKALEIRQSEANNHDLNGIQALVSLGRYYKYGWGVDTDLKQAAEYFKRAADENNSDGLWSLGQCYEHGLGVEESLELAIQYYKQALGYGEVYAAFYLACLLDRQKRYAEAFPYFKIARRSDIDWEAKLRSLVSLAEYFRDGNGVSKSDKTALDYYQLAATGGSDWALYILGKAYLKGNLGLPSNGEKALHFLERSKHKFAYQALGKMYQHGQYVTISYEKAFHYYALAAGKDQEDLDCHYAVYQLGKMYQEGRGVVRSYEKALYYYKLIADKGCRHALSRLGEMHRSGLGVEPSEEKAAFYFNLASSGDHVLCECELKIRPLP